LKFTIPNLQIYLPKKAHSEKLRSLEEPTANFRKQLFSLPHLGNTVFHNDKPSGKKGTAEFKKFSTGKNRMQIPQR
jgi:hypothetical protein